MRNMSLLLRNACLLGAGRAGAGRRVIVGALMIVGLLVAPPALAAAKSRLVASSVTAPSYAHPGGRLPVAATVSAHSSSPATKLSVYLSTDSKRNGGDVSLSPAIKVKRLRAGRRVHVSGWETVPERTRPGRWYLLVCPGAQKTGCRASAVLHITDPPTSSEDLIAAALQKGRLSATQALVDRVFAAFDDRRLPAAYRGDPDTPGSSSQVMAEVTDAWPTLPASVRAELLPFYAPPAAKGSWASPSHAAGATASLASVAESTNPTCVWRKGASGWDSTAGGHVRVWWAKSDPEGSLYAHVLVNVVNKQIWPHHQKVMGRQPLSDAHETGCFNGGDGLYDIYLWHGGSLPKMYAETVAYPPNCSGEPAFTVFGDDAHPSAWAVAHEMFHAFQDAFPEQGHCRAYAWWDEATANWAAMDIYGWQASDYPDPALITNPQLDLYFDGYANWPFVSFLVHTLGTSIVPAVYKQFANTPGSPSQAQVAGQVNSALPGGFEKQWPIFARYAWNQPPVKGGLRAWENGFPFVPGLDFPWTTMPKPTQFGLDGKSVRTWSLLASTGLGYKDGMSPLDRSPYHDLEIDDSKVRGITFKNTLYGQKGASVQAYYRLKDGTWHTADWTNQKTVHLCRDEDDQNVTRFVIFYGNSNTSGAINPSEDPSLTLRDNCNLYFQVTNVSGSYEYTYHEQDTAAPYTVYDGHDSYSLSFSPSTQYDSVTIDPLSGGYFWPYGHQSGSGRWTETQSGKTTDQCSDRTDNTGLVNDIFDPAAVSHTKDAPTAVVHFPTPSDKDSCFTIGNDGYPNPYAEKLVNVTVPWSEFTGTAPFTVSFSKTWSTVSGASVVASERVTFKPLIKALDG